VDQLSTGVKTVEGLLVGEGVLLLDRVEGESFSGGSND